MTIETGTLVIGAGLCGLTVARGLAAAGERVAVIDKGRGTGGRLSTRRAGDLRFDHGAQYLRPDAPGFRLLLSDLVRRGAAATWPELGTGAHVGLPGMSGLVKPLAEGLEIHTGLRAGAAAREGGRWRVTGTDGAPIAIASRLVCAIPAPQARQVLGGHPLAARLDAVRMAPCWTLMVAFDTPLGLPDASRDRAADLAWIARDSGKPGRGGGADCWVAQASPRWSRANLERDAQDVCGEMVLMLGALVGRDLPPPVHAAAHRWRYAIAETPLGAPCLHDAESGLAIAGDWCLGARAEHAWLSAQAALDALAAAPLPAA